MAEVEGIEFDKVSLRLLTRALRDEADGKALNRDLSRNLRVAAQPALVAVRGSILTMPSKGLGKPPSLRAAIAAGTRIHVRFSGEKAGVAIEAHSKGMPRGFKRAPRYLNREKPWRHPLFGNRERWVAQRSNRPRWFIDPLLASREGFHKAAGEALDDVAQRISRKTRG